MKVIALLKNDVRLCDQWSVIGILIYVNDASSSKLFGTFSVTFTIYRILLCRRQFKSRDVSASPRYKYGTTSTGNGKPPLDGTADDGVDPSRPLHESMSEEITKDNEDKDDGADEDNLMLTKASLRRR